MIRCVVLCLFLGGIPFAFSQDNRVLNNSENDRLGDRPGDYKSPEHNLWLITRDDPIPASLSGRWSIGDAIPVGQILNFRTNGYNNQFPTEVLENSPTAPFQSPVAVVPDTPIIAYDRTLTRVNRRQTPGEREFIREPDAFLLELPVDVTEGLWERPSQPRNLQLPVNGRQSGDVQNVDIKFEEVTGVERPGETPPAVFVPIRELTSRLPNTDFLPQGQANVPPGQYYELPIQGITSPAESSNVNERNRSSDFTNLPESRDILIYRQDRVQNAGLGDSSENVFYENYGHGSSQTDRNVHEVGSILTSEDIELLEKLGILSSLILEPVISVNVSDNVTSSLNSQREYEDKLPLIDNGGQNYSMNTGREDSANFGEVVLFDIPQFAVSEYHSNIPENSGLNVDAITISPLTAVEINNPLDLGSNGSLGNQNSVNISDRQLLEILQLLNLEVGDFFNLSRPSDIKHETRTADEQRTENYVESNQQVPITSQNVLGQATVTNSTLQSTAAKQLMNDSLSRTKVLNDNDTVSVPSVKNGRIQPRLLEKSTPKENEIMERLFQNALPISESKLDMLKKLKIQPQPYLFGFRQDDGNGTLQHRNETSDSNGVVKGSYGYRDAMGVYRNVTYIADTNGFHAVVKTNEPGMVSHNTADAVFMSETPPLAALLKMIAHKRPKNLPI